MPSPHTAAVPSAYSSNSSKPSSAAAPFIAPSVGDPSFTTTTTTATAPASIPRSRTASVDDDPASRSRSRHHGPNNSTTGFPHIGAHISSAILQPSQQQQQQQQQSFSAASLPRTSSLLPPPRLEQKSAPTILHDPFNATSTATRNLADPVTEVDASPKDTRKRRSLSHSHSSSLGGLSDGFRNLNRWSASTTSSRASNPNYQKQINTSRRMSVDSQVIFAQSTPPPPPIFNNSPRKLQKSRPSTSGGSPRAPAPGTRVRQQSPARIPPLQSLPPIATFPSLEQEVRSESPAVSARPENQRIPYFGGRPSFDTDGQFWDDSSATPLGSSAVSQQVETPDSTIASSYFTVGSNMMYTDNSQAPRERGHSRNRSQTAKSSADTTSSQKSRDRAKQPSQKAMLSKALQKANTAVQLDNALNFEGARQAYTEACGLLHQVLLRTNGEEDKKKLEAIHKTYTSRIDELEQLLPPENETEDSKALPRRPESNSTNSTYHPGDDGRESVVIETATAARIYQDAERVQQAVPSYSMPISAARRQLNTRPPPNLTIDAPRQPGSANLAGQYSLQSSFSKSPRRDIIVDDEALLPAPMDNQYMPPPLSPRRPKSPTRAANQEEVDGPPRIDFSLQGSRLTPESGNGRGHARGNSHESISWLDPIDESGGSEISSVHSRTSSLQIRRKHIRAASGDTEAEFDAALDDAIEAAYDDGYEPTDASRPETRFDDDDDDDDIVAKALRRVQLAKERVRQSEREVQLLAEESERRQLEAAMKEQEESINEGFYDGNTSDEEERMLEEMTKGYAIEDFSLKKQKKAPLPRGSDSSEFTSRTWHSSTTSNPPTATTILSTVTENTMLPPSKQAPMAPPPTQSLPKLPPQRPGSSSGPQSAKAESVRDRRLSGQKPKELKIETSKLGSPPKISEPATAAPAIPSGVTSNAQPKPASGYIAQQRQALSAGPNRTTGPFKTPSPAPGFSPGEAVPPTPPLPHGFAQDVEARAGSPSVARPALRKNFSSSSLRSMKARNLSVSNIDEISDMSPGTPSSTQFGPNASATRLPTMPSLPTPIATAFKERMNAGSSTGGLYLFDADIHSPRSPGEPNPLLGDDGPVPLEPCPTEPLLRPFWLMRALYQTLAHPRGGYISAKLFVPRDVWRVKGVKLRNVEDKASQCDLLTAALQKLAKVDTIDADAVLEEMQALEGVLEQVQSFLSRRLGNEVGVQASSTMFKDADGIVESASSAVPRNNSVSGKSGAFSWRRLRSKNSSAGMSSAYERGNRSGGVASADGGAKEGLPLASLPMTSHPTSKPSKRDLASVQFSGPNAHYMAALARLFDAAQSVDQIARQVDDPGLRHADKTQVGLELCTRHAAEFFGFYICRFVLADLTMLLDKFIKRGSEWVLV